MKRGRPFAYYPWPDIRRGKAIFVPATSQTDALNVRRSVHFWGFHNGRKFRTAYIEAIGQIMVRRVV